MRRIKLVLLFFLATSSWSISSIAQDSTRYFKASVFSMDDALLGEGYLYELANSSLFLSPSAYPSPPDIALTEISINDIQRIDFRRKGDGLKRFAIGTAAGAAFGALLGAAFPGDMEGFITFDRGESAILGAVTFGIIGGIGYLVVGAKKTVNINGSREAYFRKNSRLRKFLIKDMNNP